MLALQLDCSKERKEMTENDNSNTRHLLFHAGELAGSIGAACRGNLDLPITSVVVDSRRAVPGSLFVALTGEHVDGHDFIFDAMKRGAHTVIAAIQKKEKVFEALAQWQKENGHADDICILFVDSPLKALQDAAREYRLRHSFENCGDGSSGQNYYEGMYSENTCACLPRGECHCKPRQLEF